MTMATAFPPHRLQSSKRIQPAQALTLLSAYLGAATVDPSLHPNALLTENGPITPSTGANSSLVLHNLRRVEAGLRGEYLAADPGFEDFDEELPNAMLREHSMTALADASAARPDHHNDNNMDMEWQDKEEFEREQDIVQGEVGKRNNDPDEVAQEKAARTRRKILKSHIEKDDRRKAKRERFQKDKLARAEKRKVEKGERC